MRESQKSHFPGIAPAFTVKPLPPLSAARRKEVLAQREAWLRQIDPASLFHRLFDVIPGLQFFAKDREGKMMFMNQGNLKKFQTTDETAVIGLNDFDLSLPCLARTYVNDDARIFMTGKALLDHVELVVNEQATPEWYVVNKLPVRSRTGEIIGIMGLSQSLEERCKLLSPFQSISKVVSYVQQNYQQEISVSELARQAGFSERQLERKFKAHFGIGPRQFLLQTRLLAACRRLSGSSDSLARLAADCGFGDQSAFSRQFRRRLGMTPQEFRRLDPPSGWVRLVAALRGLPGARKEVLAQREAWLRRIDPGCLFHRLFDAIPGLQFFAKNQRGEFMFLNQGNRDKFHTTDAMAMIGLSDFDLTPPSLAQSYIDDDARIYATGRPLLNHVELGFDELAVLDWYVVNKLPIRSRAGKIIGIMGLTLPLQEQARLPAPFESISEVVSHLRQNYQQEISVGRLARLAGLSVSQLDRKFKACFGIGPRQFLLKIRLLAACRRLTATDRGLAQIAFDCGFAHPSAFAYQFRRHLGLTPSQFRRQWSLH